MTLTQNQKEKLDEIYRQILNAKSNLLYLSAELDNGLEEFESALNKFDSGLEDLFKADSNS